VCITDPPVVVAIYIGVRDANVLQKQQARERDANLPAGYGQKMREHLQEMWQFCQIL
jgi:hypothetical protein